MTQIQGGTTMPGLPLAVADAADQPQGKSAARTPLTDRLDAYSASVKDTYGEEGFDRPLIPVLGVRLPVPNSDAVRARRSTVEPADPASTTGSSSLHAASQSVRQNSHEAVAGVPLSEDFGAELLEAFRTTPLCTWQRADLIEQVFKEWNREGPSPKAARRLQKILVPGYTDTPEEPKGNVIVDAIALHLIDRGRYAPLVQDYIDSLKRGGHYSTLVDTMMRDYPGHTRDWATNMVDITLHTWDEPLPVDLREEGDPADQPAFDLEGRVLKLYRIMNADAHTNAADDDSE